MLLVGLQQWVKSPSCNKSSFQALSVLKQTLNEIVPRPKVLRITFRMLEGQLLQVIAPSLTIALPVVDLHSLPTAAQEAETLRQVTEERSQVIVSAIYSRYNKVAVE